MKKLHNLTPYLGEESTLQCFAINVGQKCFVCATLVEITKIFDKKWDLMIINFDFWFAYES